MTENSLWAPYQQNSCSYPMQDNSLNWIILCIIISYFHGNNAHFANSSYVHLFKCVSVGKEYVCEGNASVVFWFVMPQGVRTDIILDKSHLKDISTTDHLKRT